MEDLIAVFEPVRSLNNQLSIICLIIVLLAFTYLIYNHRRTVKPENRNLKQLMSLLAGFVILIGLGTAVISFITGQKFIPVKVFTKHIETSYGSSDLEDIQQLYIHNDQKLSPLTGKLEGDSTRLLMIVELGGKTHVLSEENYDIDSLMGVLRKLE